MKHAEFGPLCPRCGYDQSGLMAIWRESDECPLRGRCTECGLDFQWADVLRPGRGDLAWLYEHTPRGVGLARAWRTWAVALRPWRFWKLVRLEARLSPVRLLLWPLVLFGGLQSLLFGVNLVLNVVFHVSGPLAPMTFNEAIAMVVRSALDPLFWVQGTGGGIQIQSMLGSVPYAVAGPAAAAALIPSMLLILGQTRATSKIRLGHVLRVGIHQLAIFAPFAVFVLVQRTFDMLSYVFPSSAGVRNILVLRRAFGSVLPEIALLLAAWFALYWYSALTQGLRLQHARMVWFFLMVAGILLSAIVSLQDARFRALLGWP